MSGWNPQANDIFLKALELQAPEQRRKLLEEACGGDAELRAQVESLLAASERAGSFLGSPAEGLRQGEVETAEFEKPALEGAGTVIGRYKLLQQIGEGGMGVVFMAEQTHPVKRIVALKIIKPGMDSRLVIARFEAERQALALMEHPNIAKVLDAGTTDSGRPYFVMELVKGVPITKYCDEHHLSPRQRLELFVPVCHAVQHAHQKGIIHRDLKPSNVLVAQYDGKPVPKVIDFGVAKAAGPKLTERTMFTGFGAIIGTLEYMSPEQAELNQLDVDTRSDIYSLGVLLYELLTGSTPIEHKRLKEAALHELLRIIREEEPPKPSTRLSTSEQMPSIAANRGLEPAKLSGIVRGELDWIVMKALEKDRNRRYETANGLAMDVQRHLSDEAVNACPPSARYRFGKFARRNKVAITTTALVCAALVLGTIVSTWQAIRASRARIEAVHQADIARKEASRADHEAVEAQHRQADSIVSEARLLLGAERIGEAKVRLAQATGIYQSIGRDPIAADLTFLDALAKAPQPLNRIDTRPENNPKVAILPDRRSAIVRRTPPDQRPGVIERIDLRTGEVLQRFPHDHGISGVVVSRDGTLLLTGGATEPFDVTLWDIQQARVIRAFKGHSGMVFSVALSNDHQRVFSCGLDHMIIVWNVEDGKVVFTHKTDAIPGSMDSSPDGSLVAVAMRSGAEIWEVDTGRLRSRTPLAQYVEFSSDGKALDFGRSMGFWDVEHGGLLGEPRTATLARWSLAGYRGRFIRQDFPISFDDGVQRSQKGISVAEDGKFAAAASSPGEISLWRLEKSDDIAKLPHGGGVGWLRPVVALTPDGLAVISIKPNSHALQIRDLATGAVLGELTDDKDAAAPIVIAVSADGRWVLAGSDTGELRLWELATGRFVRAWHAHEGAVTAVGFSPDSLRAASGGSGSSPKVWDLATAREICTYGGHFQVPTAPNGGQLINDVIFTPDGRAVVSTYSGAFHVWDSLTGEQRRLLPGHSGGATDLKAAFCLRLVNSDQLLSASKDATVRLWDLQSGREIRRFEGHSGVVWSAAQSPDGRLIASASQDMTVRVWEAASGNQVYLGQAEESKPYNSADVQFSADGRLLVSSSNSLITIRDLTRPARYREFERVLPEARRRLQSNSNDTAALKVLGEWYAFRGIWDWGAEFLEKARANGADVASLTLARCYWKTGDNAAAQREFRAAIARQEAPRQYLEMCIAASASDFAPILVERARAHGNAGNFTEAIADLSLVLAKDPNRIEARQLRGACYLQLSEYARAAGDFSEMIKLRPQEHNYWLYRANVYLNLEEYKQAIDDYSKAIELKDDDGGRRGRGEGYRGLGELQKAEQDYCKAIELNPAYWGNWYVRARLYAKQGQSDKSQADLAKAVARCLSPHDQNDLAWRLAADPGALLHDPKAAIELAEKAVGAQPDSGAYWNTLGVARYRSGQWKDAITALEKSTGFRDGGDSYDFFFLAMAHWQLGEKEQARKWYDQAIAGMGKRPSKDAEFRQFHTEAASLLGLAVPSTPQAATTSAPTTSLAK